MASLSGCRAAPALALAGLLGLTSPSIAAAASEPASWPARSPPAAGERQFYVLSFTEQDIAEVTGQVLGVVLQKPFDLDPAVKGVLSFHVEAQLTRDQLLAAFKAALAARHTVLIDRHGVLVLQEDSAVPAPGPGVGRRIARAQSSTEAISPALIDPMAPTPGGRTLRNVLASSPRSGGEALDPWMAATIAFAAAALALAALLFRRLGLSFGTMERPANRTRREAVLARLSATVTIPPATLEIAKLRSAQSGRPIEQTLNDMGVVSDQALVAAYAAVTGCRVWRPEERPPMDETAALKVWPEGAMRPGLVALESRGRRLALATSDPLDDDAIAATARAAARTVTILVGSPADIRRAAHTARSS